VTKKRNIGLCLFLLLLTISALIVSKTKAQPESASEKAPPSLTVFEPQISGLSVTINGVTLPGYANASITRIHWDWGDGSSEDHWFPASHTYSKPGTYTITLTVYQSDGLSATKTLNVEVKPGSSTVSSARA